MGFHLGVWTIVIFLPLLWEMLFCHYTELVISCQSFVFAIWYFSPVALINIFLPPAEKPLSHAMLYAFLLPSLHFHILFLSHALSFHYAIVMPLSCFCFSPFLPSSFHATADWDICCHFIVEQVFFSSSCLPHHTTGWYWLPCYLFSFPCYIIFSSSLYFLSYTMLSSLHIIFLSSFPFE